MIKITNISVEDVRFPTSKDLTGSDAIHTDPDYSATYVTVETSDLKLKGYGIAFTLGEGNDIVSKCIESYIPIFKNITCDELEKNIGKLWYDCADHSQLRWLGHVSRMPFDRLPDVCSLLGFPTRDQGVPRR